LRQLIWRIGWLIAAALAGCSLGPPPGGEVAVAPPPAVAVLPPPAPPAAEPGPPAAGNTARDSYVERALARPLPPGLEGHREVGVGSGFYIAPDRLLTNFHVAGVCNVVTVGNDSEGAITLAKVIAGDAAVDLAVLATDATVATPARFETSIYAESGDDLAIVGYPEHGLAVRQAEIDPVTARQADMLADRRVYPFDGPVRHGNSGSPILDDTGAVVGVAAMKIDTVARYQRTGEVVDNVGFAIGNHAVFGFLAANKIDYLPARPAARLTPPQLLQFAHGFVRQVGCWK